MKASTINIIILGSLFLFSCNKKKETIDEPENINTSLVDGLPENKKLINGYLYSSLQTYQYSSSSSYYYMNSYAIFSDPAKNLISTFNHYYNNKMFVQSINGNIDVGNVYINGITLPKSLQSNFEVYYTQGFNSSSNFFNYNATWSTEGNKSFKPINLSIGKGYPLISTNLISIGNSISKSSNYTINFGNNISNYDSLIVILEDGNFNGKIRKTLPQNATSVTFTPQDMNVLSSSNYGKVGIYAYNYSYIILDSKVNILELSNQFTYNNIYITF